MRPVFQAVKSRGEKFLLGLTLFVLFGFSLNFWGINANGLVVLSNDNIMPVVTDHKAMIIPGEGTPRLFVPDGNFLLLADRIPINFPSIEDRVPSGFVGKIFHWWSKHLDFPSEGGLNLVSIGDLMRWVGTILFLPLLPILVILIPIRARANMRTYGNWRGK